MRVFIHVIVRPDVAVATHAHRRFPRTNSPLLILGDVPGHFLQVLIVTPVIFAAFREWELNQIE